LHLKEKEQVIKNLFLHKRHYKQFKINQIPSHFEKNYIIPKTNYFPIHFQISLFLLFSPKLLFLVNNDIYNE